MLRIKNSTRYLKYLLLTTVIIGLSACSRKEDSDKTTVTLSAPPMMLAQSVSAMNTPVLASEMRVLIVNVSDGGDGLIYHYMWDNCHDCNTPMSGPSQLSMEISNGSRLFQVLAVYESQETGNMVFKYGEHTTELKGGELSFGLSLSDVENVDPNMPVISGNVSGRYLDHYMTAANGNIPTGPTGDVAIRFIPTVDGNTRRPMEIEKSVMVNGWFNFFMLEGTLFDYTVYDKDYGPIHLWDWYAGGVMLSDLITPPSSPSYPTEGNNAVAISIPKGWRDEDWSGGYNWKFKEAEYRVYGFFGDFPLEAERNDTDVFKTCRTSLGTPANLTKVIPSYPSPATPTSSPPAGYMSISNGSDIESPIDITDGTITNATVVGGSTSCTTFTSFIPDDFTIDIQTHLPGLIDGTGKDNSGLSNGPLMLQYVGSSYGSLSSSSSGGPPATNFTVTGKLLPGTWNASPASALINRVYIYKAEQWMPRIDNKGQGISCDPYDLEAKGFDTSSPAMHDGINSSNISIAVTAPVYSGIMCFAYFDGTDEIIYPEGVVVNSYNFNHSDEVNYDDIAVNANTPTISASGNSVVTVQFKDKNGNLITTCPSSNPLAKIVLENSSGTEMTSQVTNFPYADLNYTSCSSGAYSLYAYGYNASAPNQGVYKINVYINGVKSRTTGSITIGP